MNEELVQQIKALIYLVAERSERELVREAIRGSRFAHCALHLKRQITDQLESVQQMVQEDQASFDTLVRLCLMSVPELEAFVLYGRQAGMNEEELAWIQDMIAQRLLEQAA